MTNLNVRLRSLVVMVQSKIHLEFFGLFENQYTENQMARYIHMTVDETPPSLLKGPINRRPAAVHLFEVSNNELKFLDSRHTDFSETVEGPISKLHCCSYALE
jgi:hypothetical protein